MSGATPRLSVTGFEGPLDFLIEMVRRQQVDLGQLSILTLTDQLVAAIEAGDTALERRADWLVMASELLLLKARLLLPRSPEDAEDASTDAARRLALLAELARMRAAAAWLAARPQLGQVVFARGRQGPVPRPQAELHLAFLEATLAMLEGPLPSPDAPPAAYRPSPPDLWRVPDALRHIAALLARHPSPLNLAQCLPPIPAQATDRPLRLRAALASSFSAGLEMARDGQAVLEQAAPFAAIRIASP
jgi:segregation and condensation protein A